ncbi:tetratricopeptide repeat protein [Streptomyces sp. NPDC020298]|uniref:tetratricopeptide repeat protein n=1 Tax=unclassified Streptomyces TaxID=2593676 RepID=UPI0033CE9E00
MTGRGVSRQELIRRRRRSGLVGRRGEQAAFRDALQQSPEEATQFLFHIHGPAGVGKSTLVRQLESLARDERALTAYIDESTGDVVETMEAISSQFRQEGIELKSLDKLLNTYRQRRHEADAGAGLAGVSSESTGASQGSDQQGPSPLSAIGSQLTLAGLGMIPGVGAFTGVLDPNQVAMGADRIKALLSSRLRSHEDVELVLSPLQVLTPVFLRSLTDVAERRPWIVLFFDTYERTGPVLDAWLRDILVSDRYGQLPANVLVVLAGQSQLDSQCWGDWLDLVSDLPLEVFSEAEARQLLGAKGITDENVIQVILELSGRLPVLVSTLAQARPTTAADVGDPSGTAVERFLKWETNSVRRAAALACALPQEVDEDTYRIVVDEEARGEFAWLRSMPFFIERAGRGHYHDVVRSAMLRLQRHQSPQRWKEQHLRLAETFRERRSSLEAGAPPIDGWWEDERWRSYRLQETYHRLCADYRTALPDALRELVEAHDHDITTLRRWAQTFTHAGRDTDAPRVRKWGEELLAALDDPHPGVTALTLLLSRSGLDASGKHLAYVLRGYEYRNAHSYEQSLADYAAALELESTARAFRNRGETYRLADRYEEALADFNRAIEIESDVAWAFDSRGLTYQAMHRYEEALADFNRAIEIDPDYAWAIAQRGEAYRLLSRYEEALADFNRAIGINPDYAWALASRGQTYRAMHRYEEALADFNRTIEIDPGYAWAIAHRGEAYRLAARYEEALADFDRSIEIDPDYVWALASRGQTYQAMRRYDEALADFNHAIEINPNYAWIMVARGDFYQAMSRYEEALADFNRAVEIDPDYVWAIASRGSILRLMGRLEEALADFDRVIEIKPTMTYAIASRGVVHRVSGRYVDALTDFNCAIGINPSNGWVYYEKAVALYAERDPEYRTCVSRAIELCSSVGHIADIGNLFLVHCLTSEWGEASRHLSAFFGKRPTCGEITELLTVMDTLRQIVPAGEHQLLAFRHQLESRRGE